MKYLAALVIGVGLFAQSAHAIDFYYVLMKTSNMLGPSTQQWTYKLHDDQTSCEKQLVTEAMELDGYLVEKKGSQVWAYLDWPIGNTDVPYEFLQCINLRVDVEGSSSGLYD